MGSPFSLCLPTLSQTAGAATISKAKPDNQEKQHTFCRSESLLLAVIHIGQSPSCHGSADFASLYATLVELAVENMGPIQLACPEGKNHEAVLNFIHTSVSRVYVPGLLPAL
ncbi:hypothetical protein EDC04DRAFT_81931 [Pisolithus marmoratus]|nr:hypothetical protein EDC04DRAFT_81931 [Pisolithus marmoratus]